MELQNIEILTQKYLEGETSLKEEDQLRHYYLSDNVAPHLESYKPLFNYFAKAKKEQFKNKNTCFGGWGPRKFLF